MDNMINDFENSYRNLRRQRNDGWNTEELAQSQFSIVTDILHRDDISDGMLLDLGCGDGKLTIKLAQSGFETYGIDFAPTAISWANERAKAESVSASFIVGDVLHLPYLAEQFEAVVDSFCFHCIIGEKRKTFLSEAFRVLKRSKVLIIMTKCGDPKDASYPFDPLTRCKIENGVPTRYMGLPQSIIEEVRNSGFTILDYRIFPYDHDLLVINAQKL